MIGMTGGLVGRTGSNLRRLAESGVPVDLGRNARILVAHDPLDSGQVGALHEQKRRGRVTGAVKAQLPDLADREEPELTGPAAAPVRVRLWLVVARASPTGLADVGRHHPRAAHRSADDFLHRIRNLSPTRARRSRYNNGR